MLLHGATEKQQTLNTFYSGGRLRGLRLPRLGRHGGNGNATTTVSEYLVGTLVVDIFDAKTKSLLFRGTASDEISDKPEKNIKKIDKAANKMFKDFPPGSKEKKRPRPVGPSGSPRDARPLSGVRPLQELAGERRSSRACRGRAGAARVVAATTRTSR